MYASQHYLSSTLPYLNTTSSQHYFISTLPHHSPTSSQHYLISTLPHLNTTLSQHYPISTLPHLNASQYHFSNIKGGINEGEIEVEVAACVLGELAGELSVLDSSEMRSYCVIQLCILLRLLAGMMLWSGSIFSIKLFIFIENIKINVNVNMIANINLKVVILISTLILIMILISV